MGIEQRSGAGGGKGKGKIDQDADGDGDGDGQKEKQKEDTTATTTATTITTEGKFKFLGFNSIKGKVQQLKSKVKGIVTRPVIKIHSLWKEQIGFKFFRAFRAGMIGALNNGLIHYNYYKWIDKRFPYHFFTSLGSKESMKFRLSVAWAKYWIEWPTIGVYKIISMMGLTTLFSKG